MRAVLVVNPKATTTTTRSRDVLVRALRSQMKLEVAYTEKRGHAAELAQRAALDGIEVVATLGGDGTVNEVVNGLMAVDADSPAGRAADRPALAVVPGGSTNVFARAVGLPKDWAEGTGVILEALRSGRTRTLGLGRADERYFTFCAGVGMDAEVIHRVEQARRRGAVSNPSLYLRSMLIEGIAGARRDPTLTLERPGRSAEPGLSTAIVQNVAPWTYIGDRPVQASPDASFELGLDVLAMRGRHVARTAVTAVRMLGRRPNLEGKRVLQLHDLESFTLRSTTPMAFQVDGDYLGERTKLDFVSVPDALRVVC